MQKKERGQNLVPPSPQECNADARFVQPKPREHMVSVPAPTVTDLATDLLLHRLMLGEACSSLPGLVGRGWEVVGGMIFQLYCC